VETLYAEVCEKIAPVWGVIRETPFWCGALGSYLHLAYVLHQRSEMDAGERPPLGAFFWFVRLLITPLFAGVVSQLIEAGVPGKLSWILWVFIGASAPEIFKMSIATLPSKIKVMIGALIDPGPDA